jgi:hypothetical protein
MSEVELREHARALRATRDGAFAGAAATRQRILVAAHHRKRGRRVLVVACASMATLLVLSTAWAELSGVLPHVVTLVRATATTAPRERAAVHSAPASVPALASAPAPASASALASAPAPAPATIDPVSRPPSQAVVSARESSAVRSRGASRRAADTNAALEESAYEAAHRAHFAERDPSKALRGWDAYLAAYPEGRFALEARYNRALTLVRLGRTDEARAALGPFADGRYGTYRRAEARELLDALSGLVSP